MRLEISYRGGTTHEVEVPGSACVLGRDPGCDVVLNDSKCSRRHAVIEDGAGGVVVRDSGSANGIFVNSKRVETAPLRPGDTLRLGDTQIRLLAEIGETVIVAPEDLELGPPTDAPRTPGPDLARRSGAEPPPPRVTLTPPPRLREPPPPARRSRPATVTVLVGLWALLVPASIAALFIAASRLGAGALGWTLAGLGSLVLAGLGTAMAMGLLSLAPWARHLQIALAALGLLACPFTLASATVLLYMTRPEVKAAFEGPTRSAPPAGSGTADATFALSIVGMLVLGLALTSIAVLLF